MTDFNKIHFSDDMRRMEVGDHVVGMSGEWKFRDVFTHHDYILVNHIQLLCTDYSQHDGRVRWATREPDGSVRYGGDCSVWMRKDFPRK